MGPIPHPHFKGSQQQGEKKQLGYFPPSQGYHGSHPHEFSLWGCPTQLCFHLTRCAKLIYQLSQHLAVFAEPLCQVPETCRGGWWFCKPGRIVKEGNNGYWDIHLFLEVVLESLSINSVLILLMVQKSGWPVVELGSLSHYLPGVIPIQTVVLWDFWTINSICISFCSSSHRHAFSLRIHSQTTMMPFESKSSRAQTKNIWKI